MLNLIMILLSRCARCVGAVDAAVAVAVAEAIAGPWWSLFGCDACEGFMSSQWC